MPTYDYKCPDCGHEFEEFQTMTAKPIRKCPKCGKRRVKRLIGTGLQPIFKGSGFYETDYVKKAKPSEGDSKPEAKHEAKTESKPEPKPAESKPAKSENKPAKKK
ncbi:MAG: zinc ribbon domain-containing protein [Planctomycetes bacterium]|nr:zinc ribbon domain-containing protein [Planctomycetota bacterium]